MIEALSLGELLEELWCRASLINQYSAQCLTPAVAALQTMSPQS
jgi:hypothetical protein